MLSSPSNNSTSIDKKTQLVEHLVALIRNDPSSKLLSIIEFLLKDKDENEFNPIVTFILQCHGKQEESTPIATKKSSISPQSIQIVTPIPRHNPKVAHSFALQQSSVNPTMTRQNLMFHNISPEHYQNKTKRARRKKRKEWDQVSNILMALPPPPPLENANILPNQTCVDLTRNENFNLDNLGLGHEDARFSPSRELIVNVAVSHVEKVADIGIPELPPTFQHLISSKSIANKTPEENLPLSKRQKLPKENPILHCICLSNEEEARKDALYRCGTCGYWFHDTCLNFLADSENQILAYCPQCVFFKEHLVGIVETLRKQDTLHLLESELNSIANSITNESRCMDVCLSLSTLCSKIMENNTKSSLIYRVASRFYKGKIQEAFRDAFQPHVDNCVQHELDFIKFKKQ